MLREPQSCNACSRSVRSASRRKLTVHLLIALIASLALASTATAKNLTAQACGDDGCASIGDFGVPRLILASGGSVAPAPATTEYYVLDFTSAAGDGEHGFSTLFVPSKGLVGANAESPGELAWHPIDGAALDAVRDAVRDLGPFAGPARWEGEIKSPERLPFSTPVASDSERDGAPWLTEAAAVTVALGAGALLARRLRMRRPTTA